MNKVIQCFNGHELIVNKDVDTQKFKCPYCGAFGTSTRKLNKKDERKLFFMKIATGEQQQLKEDYGSECPDCFYFRLGYCSCNVECKKGSEFKRK